MFKILICDIDAESRNRVLDKIQSEIDLGKIHHGFYLSVSINTVTPNELKFSGIPDLLIIGPGISEIEPTKIPEMRDLMESTPFLGILSSTSLSRIENLLRLGITDVISFQSSTLEILQKLIVISRSKKNSATGKVILVDSGKGGLGVTSLSGAIGEIFAEANKKVCLIDFDMESQDLSRFLKLKPYINDTFGSLLIDGNLINQEVVKDMLIKPWDDQEFYFLSAAPLLSGIYDERNDYIPSLHRIIEQLDSQFDYIVIDSGSLRGRLLDSLYELVDIVFFLISGDPASLYASLEKLSKTADILGPTAKLYLVDNRTTPGGLSEKFCKDEILKLIQFRSIHFGASLPYAQEARRWIASGKTINEFSKSLKKRLVEMLVEISLIDRKKSQSILSKLGSFVAKEKSEIVFKSQSESKEQFLDLRNLGRQLHYQPMVSIDTQTKEVETEEDGNEAEDFIIPQRRL